MCVCVCVCVCESLSRVWLFSTPWTVAHQAPLIYKTIGDLHAFYKKKKKCMAHVKYKMGISHFMFIVFNFVVNNFLSLWDSEMTIFFQALW